MSLVCRTWTMKKTPYIYIGNVTYTLKFRICTCIQSHLNSGFKNKFLLMSFIDVAYSLNKFSKWKYTIWFNIKLFCILSSSTSSKSSNSDREKKGSNESVNDLSKLGTRDEWRGNRRTKKEHIRHFKLTMKLTDNVVRNYRVAKIFRENTDRINRIDFSSDGNTLISSSDDDSIVIYDCQNGT